MKFDGEMGHVSTQGPYTRLTLIGAGVDRDKDQVWTLLSKPEVKDLIKLLEASLDTTAYVQVQVGSYTRLTYIDPTGTLKVGDRVLVPFGFQNHKVPGIVKATGRGSYTGPCKTVNAKLITQELSA